MGGGGWLTGKRLGGLRWFEAEKEGKWEGKKKQKNNKERERDGEARQGGNG